MFLNFKTTFSSNFFGLGSIAAIIILLPKYLCTKWFENEPEWDTNMVVLRNYLHILADILYVGKITPVDAIQQISVNKMFCSICRIANYSVDNVNHPSNNQGQVFWAQRRQYCYLVLPVPFLLGWLFGSMSCRFLYTHPTTTDPRKGKSMYFLQAIKQINPINAGFGSKAWKSCELSSVRNYVNAV